MTFKKWLDTDTTIELPEKIQQLDNQLRNRFANIDSTRLNALDKKLLEVIPNFSITITQEALDKAYHFASTVPDSSDRRPRTVHEKRANWLMELAEQPFYDNGIPRAQKYKDLDCTGSTLLPGIVDIKTFSIGQVLTQKTFNSWKHHNFNFVMLYDRMFDEQDLEKRLVAERDLIGFQLSFSFREILPSTREPGRVFSSLGNFKMTNN